MKTPLSVLLGGLLSLLPFSGSAQLPNRPGPPLMAGRTPNPGISGSVAKLFGENSAFSADLEIQSQSGSNQALSVTGRMVFDQGNFRFEMDMAEMQSNRMPPQTIAHMKSMGMDKFTIISRPDKKITYMVYPGLQGYFENTIPDNEAAGFTSEGKLEMTELGKEEVDGHPCIKNKAMVIDKDGNRHESTTWNATDLKKFPIKIQTSNAGTPSTMVFKNLDLTKPAATVFEPPADFTKHANMMDMMQKVMAKRARTNAVPGFPLRPPVPQ